MSRLHLFGLTFYDKYVCLLKWFDTSDNETADCYRCINRNVMRINERLGLLNLIVIMFIDYD